VLEQRLESDEIVNFSGLVAPLSRAEAGEKVLAFLGLICQFALAGERRITHRSARPPRSPSAFDEVPQIPLSDAQVRLISAHLDALQPARPQKVAHSIRVYPQLVGNLPDGQ
jgi:hypothetical protein